jgi:ABC-2 type transport system ATP-binding protein
MTNLAAEELAAGYRGRAVVQSLELSYGPGIHLVLGPNGAGKTTTFRALAGVLPPLGGRVLVDGRDPWRDVAAKTLLGVATHRTPLAARLSVVDNLRYFARLTSGPQQNSIEARIETVLSVLDLGGLADLRDAQLSRGQSQRVGLAKALLADAPILLLDEPTSGLDPLHAAAEYAPRGPGIPAGGGVGELSRP